LVRSALSAWTGLHDNAKASGSVRRAEEYFIDEKVPVQAGLPERGRHQQRHESCCTL
jgi:hypothetical protein